MSNSQQLIVNDAAYLTLHYRLAGMDGTDFVSTFHDHPATLQMGSGQLAPFLEACLFGLPEGEHRTFDLPPEQAFGPRNPDLIQRISRAALDTNAAGGKQSTTCASRPKQYAVGDFVEFTAPNGDHFAGVLREINEHDALLDFNHPLAGQHVIFEVKIIGIL